jgi:hypothetical protein
VGRRKENRWLRSFIESKIQELDVKETPELTIKKCDAVLMENLEPGQTFV